MSVIDRTYPLAQTAVAIADVEAGHARGKVVVTIG
jgi:NADPH:quinone reductase-like Zn-dependent oxidoreductase